MSKKTLRYIIGSLEIGGGERNLLDLARGLVQNGYEITVIPLTDKLQMRSDFEASGIRVVNSPRIYFARKLPRLLQIIMIFFLTIHHLYKLFKEEPDVATHLMLPQAYWLGMIAATLARIKAPLFMSRLSSNEYQSNFLFIRYFEILLHKRVTCIFANSLSIVNQLVQDEKVPLEKIELIYGGIDTKAFESSFDRASFRRNLGYKESDILIVCLANLHEYKGHKYLLEAVSLIKEKGVTNSHLLIIGRDCGSLEQLKNQAQMLGIMDEVSWLGTIPTISEVLRAADIGVLASLQEGFPNVIIEEMAAGLPVVASRVGGIPEALSESCGYLVPPADSSALAERLFQLCTSAELRQQMGCSGRDIAFSKFNLQRFQTEFRNVYERF